MNVLIVEDEKALTAELEIFLINCSYVCDVCFDGRSASEKIATNLYDFILIDLGLPDYEGLDLLKEAKKYNPEATCIILTARAEVNDRIKGLDLGADDYLAKPFSLLELQSRMQAITQGRQKGAGAAPFRSQEFLRLVSLAINRLNHGHQFTDRNRRRHENRNCYGRPDTIAGSDAFARAALPGKHHRTRRQE